MGDLFDVSGKVVLVTGGGSGIGRMIAQAFVERGARVYIAARNAERLTQAAAGLSESGQCAALPADLSRTEGVAALVEAMALREKHLDVLVNNAGAAASASLDEFTEEMWDNVMDMNAKAVFFLTQKFPPLLRANATADNTARVINIVSTAGLKPPPFEAYSYASSKAATIMTTRHMAKALTAQHILVNAIAPGPFATDMMADRIASAGEMIRNSNPLKRLGTPEDIAGCALFLASRASAWTTGAVIPCDGGSSTTIERRLSMTSYRRKQALPLRCLRRSLGAAPC
jgi:NAD(P)-dependent dehydrogenase (short-subunit alcohol dehydrogenase family)